MDTQQLVILICRDPKIRGHIFDGNLDLPIVKARLDIYKGMAAPSVNMNDVLEMVPLMLSRASLKQQGGKISLSDVISLGKNVVMNGITVTMRSILERDFDKDRIDANLREGAANRKMYIDKYKVAYTVLRNKYPRMSTNEIKIRADEVATNVMKKQAERLKPIDTKYAITSVKKDDKSSISINTDPLSIDGRLAVNYSKALEILAKNKPKSELDVQLSEPLPEEPLGKTGVSIIQD